MVPRTVIGTAIGVSLALVVAMPATAEPVVAPVEEDRVRYEVVETTGRIAEDSSHYVNHGKMKGRVARRNGVYRFRPVSKKGVHSIIRARPHDSFNPGLEPFSFGARVKVRPDAKWQHREMALLRHGDTDTPGGDYKLELRRLKSGIVDVLCEMHDGDGDGSAYIQGNGPIETMDDGMWHTISCARVDVDTVRLTIDDHYWERPTKGDFGAIVGGDPFLIGVQPWVSRPEFRFREQFHGKIDDIHLTVQVPPPPAG